MAANVGRLKTYKERLILFPRKAGQFKKLDSSKEELAAASSGVKDLSSAFPINNASPEEAVSEIKKSEIPSAEGSAYRTIREARSAARLVGVREKRAKAKAEEAEAQKK